MKEILCKSPTAIQEFLGGLEERGKTWRQGEPHKGRTSGWDQKPKNGEGKEFPRRDTRAGVWKGNKWTFYLEGSRKIWRSWGGRWSFGERSDFAIKMFLVLGLQKLPSEKNEQKASSEWKESLASLNKCFSKWMSKALQSWGGGRKTRKCLK